MISILYLKISYLSEFSSSNFSIEKISNLIKTKIKKIK